MRPGSWMGTSILFPGQLQTSFGEKNKADYPTEVNNILYIENDRSTERYEYSHCGHINHEKIHFLGMWNPCINTVRNM